MAQRMFNLTKWTRLEEGQAMLYDDPRQRMVGIEVNCPEATAFYVLQDRQAVADEPERKDDIAAGRRVAPLNGAASDLASSDEDKTVTFLAFVRGRDRLEFGVEGAFQLLAEAGSAMIYTPDGDDVATRIVSPVILTKIANRRARNPQLELMQYQMRLNQEAFMAAMEDESGRRIKALEKKLESYAPERNPGTTFKVGDFKQPTPAGELDSPGASAGETPEDEDESTTRAKSDKKRKKASGSADDSGSLI